MKITNPKILILGVTGMLGGTIYKYLSKKYKNVYGTSRKSNPELIRLNAQGAAEQLRTVLLKIKPAYVINCIGILREGNKKNFKAINSDFPKTLAQISNDLDFKIINISTDAVFGAMQGKVNEDSVSKPEDEYGKSKLAGEQKVNTLNIRTSLLGFDPNKQKGLLEKLINNKHTNVIGYTNQEWSGATVLQLTKFIEDLIYNKKFKNLFKKTSVIHFAPINSVSKYNIVETFSNLLKLRKSKSGLSNEVNRSLKSKYISDEKLKQYGNSLRMALKELIKFNKDYLNTYE